MDEHEEQLPVTMTDDVTVPIQGSVALSPVIERGLLAARAHPGATLKELAEAITDEPPLYWGGSDLVPFPDLAPTVTFTKEVDVAIAALPDVFGKVQPETRRVLTETEIKAVYDEDQTLRVIEGVIKGRREALKTSLRHHLDVEAEEQNRAVPRPVVVKKTGEVKVEASPRDAHGHYVLGTPGDPERVFVPGTNDNYAREYRGGTTSLSGTRLEELYQAGEIGRQDYLAFTVSRRVFSEERARTAITAEPRLFHLLARITERGGVSSALFLRKNPK